MKRVITDYRISPENAAELRRLGYEVIPTMPLGGVYEEIKGHTDIQIHIAGGKAICAPSVYEYYKSRLGEVIRGSVEPGRKYPADIAYNACAIGGMLVCNEQYTAPEILSEYGKVLNTRQGYAKCSICVVSDTAAITADEGIYRRLTASGIETLKIRPGHISLYGMDGFIGGASGLVERDLLVFNGDLGTHPDGEAIASFCRGAGVRAVSLGGGLLCDVGGILSAAALSDNKFCEKE